MPAETARQERLWMSFPRPNATLGDGEDAEEARRAWTAVAHAALEFEPVTMLVDPETRDDARRHLSADVDVLEVPLDEYWLRDSGPTFVLGDDGRLGAVDWIFNGWGANDDWTSWEREQHVAGTVAEAAGAEVVPSLLVNEGGAIHVDGEGTVLLTGPCSWTRSATRTPTRRGSRRSSPAPSAPGTPSGCREGSPATTSASAPAGTSTSWRPSRRPGGCCCTSSGTRRIPTPPSPRS